jgi:BirA family biotin operon repressor/biotin-[acetyl-CoA-carboxylase] ligase
VTFPETAWSPLEREALAAAAGPAWTVTLLPRADSTNAAAARSPVPGTLVVADHQTAGRGRLDRTWETPPGSALTFSAVVDPRLDDALWPLLPLATALAVADGVHRVTGLDLALKWPNDLLVGDGKVAGILLERVTAPGGPVAIIGIGLNVGMSAEQLPVPTATSLALAGVDADRTALLGGIAQALAAGLAALRADPPGMLTRYREACSTLGREVTVHLPDGSEHRGTATEVDEHGRLVVAGRAIGAGDVLHVRARE